MIVTARADRGRRPGRVDVDMDTEFLREDLVRRTEDLVEAALLLEAAALNALSVAALKAVNKRRLHVRIDEADRPPAVDEAVLEILRTLPVKVRPEPRLEERRVDLRASVALARGVYGMPEPGR